MANRVVVLCVDGWPKTSNGTPSSYRRTSYGSLVFYLGCAAEMLAGELNIANRSTFGQRKQVLDATVHDAEHQSFSYCPRPLGGRKAIYRNVSWLLYNA